RFSTITQEARFASLQGIGGGLRSAVALARATYIAKNLSGATVSLDGQNIDVVTGTGVPAASVAGIGTAMVKPSDWTTTADPANPLAGSVTWTPAGAPAGCDVTYTAPGGTVVVN